MPDGAVLTRLRPDFPQAGGSRQCCSAAFHRKSSLLRPFGQRMSALCLAHPLPARVTPKVLPRAKREKTFSMNHGLLQNCGTFPVFTPIKLWLNSNHVTWVLRISFSPKGEKELCHVCRGRVAAVFPLGIYGEGLFANAAFCLHSFKIPSGRSFPFSRIYPR